MTTILSRAKDRKVKGLHTAYFNALNYLRARNQPDHGTKRQVIARASRHYRAEKAATPWKRSALQGLAAKARKVELGVPWGTGQCGGKPGLEPSHHTYPSSSNSRQGRKQDSTA